MTTQAILRFVMNLTATAVCLTLALLFTSCGSGSVNRSGQPPAPAVQPPAGLLAQLPALPPPPGAAQIKSSSAVASSYISGIGIYQGQGYGVDGGSVTLPSTPGTLVWAMYIGSSAGDDVDRLEVDASGTGSGMWVAISDYASGRWRFLGNLTSPGAFDLPDGDYTRQSGGFYLLVLSFDGGFGKHNFTVAKFDNGNPQGPIVSGVVTDENGAPLGGTLVYAMPGPIEAYTDATGTYQMSMPADDTYTFNAEKSGYTMMPADQQVVVAGADVTGVDFSGISLDIRGTIMEGGTPLAGVQLSFQGGGPIVFSRIDGTYEFTGLSDGMVTIVPKLAGYSFDPPTIDVTVQGMDVDNQDFAATGGQPTFAIRGTVTDLGTGQGLAGAGIQLLPDYDFTQTDANGNFEFAGLAPDQYSIKAFKQGYSITPMEIATPIVNADLDGNNFDAQPLFKLEGYLKGSGGFPLRDVTVTLTPGGNTTSTNSSGYYTFGNRAPGNYTVTPSSIFYTFSNSSEAVTITNANITVPDMVGALTGAVTYTNFISGSLSAHCLSCHSNTAINPVDPYMRNYSEAFQWGSLSNARIQAGTMPVDYDLSEQSKELWSKWVSTGKAQ